MVSPTWLLLDWGCVCPKPVTALPSVHVPPVMFRSAPRSGHPVSPQVRPHTHKGVWQLVSRPNTPDPFSRLKGALQDDRHPHAKKRSKRQNRLLRFGGERGIRTLETLLTPTRFPIVRLRPAQPSLHGLDNVAYYNHFLSTRQEVKCKSLKKFAVVANRL